MFELQLLVANIFVPGLIVVAAYGLSSRRPAAGTSRSIARWQPAVFALASFLAIWSAFSLRNGWSLWPEDAWQRIPVAALLVAMATALTDMFGRFRAIPAVAEDAGTSAMPSAAPQNCNGLNLPCWLARVAALAVATLIVFPGGESWAELQSSKWWWVGTITGGVGAAWFALSRCQPPVAPSVGLALIPWTIAAAVLVSQSFMKVTEPILAIATVIGIASLLDLLKRNDRALTSVLGVTLFAAAAAIAQGHFYSYLDIPRSVYGLAIATPLLIAIAGRLGQYKSARVGQVLAVLVAIALSALIISRTL